MQTSRDDTYNDNYCIIQTLMNAWKGPTTAISMLTVLILKAATPVLVKQATREMDSHAKVCWHDTSVHVNVAFT